MNQHDKICDLQTAESDAYLKMERILGQNLGAHGEESLGYFNAYVEHKRAELALEIELLITGTGAHHRVENSVDRLLSGIATLQGVKAMCGC